MGFVGGAEFGKTLSHCRQKATCVGSKQDQAGAITAKK